jgi:hypothetical protein
VRPGVKPLDRGTKGHASKAGERDARARLHLHLELLDMRVKTTLVYARGATVAVQLSHFAAIGRVPGEVRVEALDQLDDRQLGAAVRESLASVREGVDPDDYPDDALYRAFGARTWRSFVTGVSAVRVGWLEWAFELIPMRNDGDDGFSYAVALARTVPLTATDTELGAAVIAAFTLSQPPADLRDPIAMRQAAVEPELTAELELLTENPADDLIADIKQMAGQAADAQPISSDDLLSDIQRMAADAAEALTTSGYRADFSVASLHDVDRFFDDALRRPGKARRNGALSRDLGAKLLAIGGYVGETLRRHADAAWVEESTTAEDEVQMRLPDGSIIWPVQRVMARFSVGPEAGLHAYGAALTNTNPK